MSRSTILLALAVTTIVVVTMSRQSHGQADFCPALVERALSEVGNNCMDLGRNTACYGFNRVDATFTEVQPDASFSQPADQIEIDYLDTLSTAALNVDTSEWGIAVINVQANLPDILPGQVVTMLLLGDVEVTNTAQQTAEFEKQYVEIVTSDWLNFRSRPSLRANVLGSIPPDTAFVTDGTSENGEWLRIAYQNRLGWVNRQYVSGGADLDGLAPVVEPPPGAMQAFYLRTGILGTSCEESPPSMLLVQSPNNIEVALTVNGLDFSIGSTIGLLAPRDTQTLSIGVFDGHVEFEDGTRIPRGFAAEFDIDDSGEANADSRAVRPFSQEELAQFQALEGLPGQLFSYDIDVQETPSMPDTLVPLSTTSAITSSPEPTLSQETASSPTPTNTPAISTTATATTVAPTPSGTPTPTLTRTPVPATPTSTATMTKTPVPSTPTPTSTATMRPTNTSTPTATSTATPASVQALGISAPCVANDGEDRLFIISNPNGFAVNFSWVVHAYTGSNSVPANGTTTITVPNQLNLDNIMNVNWAGGSASANSNWCPTSTPTPLVPTATATPEPPTATHTPLPTETPTPTPTQA